MNIVYHCTDLFAPITAVSIISIFENNKEAEKISVYIVENKVSDSNKLKIKQMAEQYSRDIFFLPMPNIQEDYKFSITQVKKKWLLDSYCRLFLGTILPESVERVLYLDSDTLCNGSLKELYSTNLEECYCGGVSDCLGEKYYNLFDMDKNSSYCNSGMLLFDLKAWRANKLEDIVVQCLRKNNGYVFFMEQSVMNIVLQNRIKIMHPKYNTYTLLVTFTYKNLYRLRQSVRFYTKEEILEAKANPVIMHLTNGFNIKGRAWMQGNNHPFKNLFIHYRKLTPWKDESMFADQTSLLKKLFLIIMRYFPEAIVCSCVGFVYNQWRPNHIARTAERQQRILK